MRFRSSKKAPQPSVEPDEMRKLIRAADDLISQIPEPDYLLIRPVEDLIRTPTNFFRLGILLSGLQVGDHTVLDFGAGTCWLSLILNKMGARTISLDVSSATLKLGQRLFRNDPYTRSNRTPSFLLFDGYTIALKNESVDRIVCYDSFHHVPNMDETLKEFYRILKPGGRVGMCEPGEAHHEEETAKHDIEEFGVHEDAVTPNELVHMSQNAGFAEVFLNHSHDHGVYGSPQMN